MNRNPRILAALVVAVTIPVSCRFGGVADSARAGGGDVLRSSQLPASSGQPGSSPAPPPASPRPALALRGMTLPFAVMSPDEYYTLACHQLPRMAPPGMADCAAYATGPRDLPPGFEIACSDQGRTVASYRGWLVIVPCDYDGDGDVDLGDYRILQSPSPAPTPEPTPRPTPSPIPAGALPVFMLFESDLGPMVQVEWHLDGAVVATSNATGIRHVVAEQRKAPMGRVLKIVCAPDPYPDGARCLRPYMLDAYIPRAK